MLASGAATDVTVAYCSVFIKPYLELILASCSIMMMSSQA